ncbi:hypothetical protein [Catenuloplanes atrovinosus]|uniref:Uncharacterized protein n=1 Tax=Catenuloplanes atrovinosus TaxID=137266 RepID=A0AAE4CDI7_9ACTN|nr:hypothetical protein [Catenuloplanes atrovinosus]MDR7277560.1 hypothetical protein [Catenuloplanes atrovinosus]
MWETARMAGYFAAHAVWSVSDGETLVPMYGYETPDGRRGLDRFPGDLRAAATAVRAALRDNPHGAVHAVSVLDAFIDLPGGKTDALIVEAVGYPPADFALRMAIPYRPEDGAAGFAVHRPKFLGVTGAPQEEYQKVAEAFFEGVDAHEKAGPIWAAHLDESR